MNLAPVVRDIVLVGGGHSHALVVRRFGMRPLPGVRVTLVSDGVLTPYSGMLPGLVAGHYTHDEVHIDLFRLCQWAGVRFIDARMQAIDVTSRSIVLRGRPRIGYDLLSLDTGSTPDLSIEGAARFATPVKPVHDFEQRWNTLRQRARRAAGAPLDVAVVGSGAGGFEIVMAVRHALQAGSTRVHWVLRDELPLGGRHLSARRAALHAAAAAAVTIHTGFDVARVTAGPKLQAQDGRSLALDELLWCTGATGPDWPAAAGLQTDARGFVATDAWLRSVSHPDIFATGDIGTQIATPSPKAGVHAVRQAPVLYRNLCACISGEPLHRYRPQRDFLSLMATGPQHAIASRGPLTVSGAWVWRWKDFIDRRFMQRFVRLPVMALRGAQALLPDRLAPLLVADVEPGLHIDASLSERPSSTMRCRGCGAKVANDLLAQSLQRIADGALADRQDETTGAQLGAGDVAIVDPHGCRLVQSVDQLSALIDDPWRFARIATLHALTDVLTVQARPHSALLSLTMPPAGPRVQRRELDAVLDAVVAVLDEHDMRLIGGHSAEGPQLQIGLTINALQSAMARSDSTEPRAGDALVLSRPIGSGVLFAGAMRGLARGDDLVAALTLMEQSQQAIAQRLRAAGSRAMTDVTGFGLAGHLERMLAHSGLVARLQADRVPMLDGAADLARRGVGSSAWHGNAHALDRMAGAAALPHWLRLLLADPQTAGGLLAVVPADALEGLVASLPGALFACIGTLSDGARHAVAFDVEALQRAATP